MKKFILVFVLFIPLVSIARSVYQGDETLRVRGVFIAKETPDQVNFSIIVKHTAPDFKSCSDGLIMIARDVTEQFVLSGLDREQLRMSGLTVNEHYSFRHGERVREGFVGTVVLEIQALLSREVTAMFFAGIHSLNHEVEYSVRFSMSEQQKERLDRSSLEKATEDARQKAEIMAKANGLELLRINRISLGEDNPGVFRQSEFELAREGKVFMDSGSGFPELSLNPQEITLYRSVEMEWIISNKKQ